MAGDVGLLLGVTVRTRLCVCSGVGLSDHMLVCLGHDGALSEIIWLFVVVCVGMCLGDQTCVIFLGHVTPSIRDCLIVYAPQFLWLWLCRTV